MMPKEGPQSGLSLDHPAALPDACTHGLSISYVESTKIGAPLHDGPFRRRLTQLLFPVFIVHIISHSDEFLHTWLFCQSRDGIFAESASLHDTPVDQPRRGLQRAGLNCQFR